MGMKSDNGCTVYKNTENEKQDTHVTLTLFIQAIEKQGRDKEGSWRMEGLFQSDAKYFLTFLVMMFQPQLQ